jgi:hypothetical protein
MKKVVVYVAVAMFFVMMPFVSFAKQALSEKELSSTTAQEGVTIQFGGATYPTTNFYIAGQFAPTLQSWGDGDGCSTCGGYTSGGWVGTKNLTMGPASAIIFYNNMTIDIGTSGTVTKTFVGLPSVLVHPVTTNSTLALGTTKDLNDGQANLGTIFNDQFALVVNPAGAAGASRLAISNHAGTGNEGLDIAFSGNNIGYGAVALFSIPNTKIIQSWGDSDGDQSGNTTYTGGGFFGSKDFQLGVDGAPSLATYFNIAVSGTMTIDVGTDSAGNTGVIIGLPTVNLYNANISSPMVFATDKELATNVQSLGTAYTGGIQISPSGSLAITAH